jgi:hypothetical protein
MTDHRIDIHDGVDTDHDGHPDTVLLPDEVDLALAVDTDRDGFADLIVRIGADAAARVGPPDALDLAAGLDDPLACYADPLDPSPW